MTIPLILFFFLCILVLGVCVIILSKRYIKLIPFWFTLKFHFHYTVKMFDEGNDCPALSYEYIFTRKRFISFTYLISIISVLHKVLTRCYSLRHWMWPGRGNVMFASRSFRAVLYVHHTQSQQWLTWQFSVSPLSWDLSCHFNEPLELSPLYSKPNAL